MGGGQRGQPGLFEVTWGRPHEEGMQQVALGSVTELRSRRRFRDLRKWSV